MANNSLYKGFIKKIALPCITITGLELWTFFYNISVLNNFKQKKPHKP